MATFIWRSVLFSDIYNRNLKENQIFQTFSNKASDFAASAFNCRLVTWCIDALRDPFPRRPLRQPSREMPIFPVFSNMSGRYDPIKKPSRNEAGRQAQSFGSEETLFVRINCNALRD
jgi:hypothetical protein